MELNYKEKSLILAGLEALFFDKNWKSSLHLMDLRETLKDKDIHELAEKVAGACHKDLDNGTDETLTDRHKAVDTRGLSPYAK